MFCGMCGKQATKCICTDLNDRMREASDSPYVILKWCKKCDSYYARCDCVEPDWMARTGGELVPSPK